MTDTIQAKQLILNLFQVQRVLLNKVNLKLSCHGISFSELTVMYQLSLATNATLSRIELAQSVGLSASGVTRLLAPMEKTGLIIKQANARDARVSLVQLSEAGQQRLSEALVTFNEFATQSTKSMSEQQIQQSITLLSQLG